MARRINEQNQGPDNGGMRILYVELNGSNTTLQEGLRTLVAAMNKPVQVTPAHKRIASTTSAVHSAPAEPDDPNLFDQDGAAASAAEHGIDVDEPSGTNGTTRRPRGEGLKTDRNAGLQLVPDLDLIPTGKQSLTDFIAEKKPSTAEEQVLLFVYYMSETLTIAPITASHVLSCFKPAGKKIPVDLRGTIRNMAKKKAWISSDLENLRISTQGSNHVRHNMGKGAAAEPGEGG